MKRKLISLLLAVTMAISMFKTVALAASAEEAPKEEAKIACEICGHEHSKDCGYMAPTEGNPCSHTHDENCGFTEGDVSAPCNHAHTAACGYVEAVEGAPCQHECEPKVAAAPSVRSVSGTEYVVSGEADFQGAIVEIENAAESEATIVFKSGFDVSGFNGVAGKHITLKSETNAVSITNMGTSLVGGLTLDNVEAYTSSSNIYANGHRFETTERFAGTIGKLYGGGEQDVTSGGTSLVLRGGTFYYVYGGGNNANVKGDTHVLLDGATAWSLIGGGYGQEAGKGNVDGSSYLHILSGQVGADNRWPDNVYIYAGGYNSTKANPETIAVVTGDSHLIIGGQGGVDGDIVYPERSYKLYAGSYFSTVEGNTYLTMGQGSQLHNDSTSTTGGYYPTLYGGGQGDIIGGCVAVEITAGENAQYTDAERTSCKGVTLYMGGNYKDSKANTVVQNKNGKAHAMTLTMSGGALNTIYAQRGESVYAGDVYSGIEGDVSLDISGGMVNYVVGAHGSGRMEDGNLTSHSDLTITGGIVSAASGHRTVTLKNYGTEDLPAVMESVNYVQKFLLENSFLKIGYKNWNPAHTGAKEPMPWVKDLVLNHSHIYTDDAGIVTISDYSLRSTGSYTKAEGGSVTLTDSKWVADNIIGIYGSMTLANSTLALKSNQIPNPYLIPNINRIHGDFTADNATLYINVVDPAIDGGNYANSTDNSVGGVVRLQIEGTASGNCGVYLVEQGNYPALTDPAIGDNYILARNGLLSTFTLANESALAQNLGFVEKRGSLRIPLGGNSIDRPVGTMWQVGTVYTVTFDKNGGDTEASPNRTSIEVTDPAGTYTVGTLPTPPNRTGYQFKGWNTQSDGKGAEFQANTPVTQSMTVYAQWEVDNGGATKYYDLTFETNGGSAIPAQREEAYATVQLTQVPLKEGYTFEGWYANKDLTEKITSVYMDGDKTVYAKWTLNTAQPPINPVEPSKPDKLPQTGDSSMAGLWMILSVLSGLGLFFSIKKRERDQ